MTDATPPTLREVVDMMGLTIQRLQFERDTLQERVAALEAGIEALLRSVCHDYPCAYPEAPCNCEGILAARALLSTEPAP